MDLSVFYSLSDWSMNPESTSTINKGPANSSSRISRYNLSHCLVDTVSEKEREIVQNPDIEVNNEDSQPLISINGEVSNGSCYLSFVMYRSS